MPALQQLILLPQALRREADGPRGSDLERRQHSNYFNYVKDSFGQWWVYSAHIDYIEQDADWTVANFADEDSLYLWGPDMPQEFPVNVELQP